MHPRPQGGCALSLLPAWLLGLEIRELLLISLRPHSPRAPLLVILPGEMSKRQVTLLQPLGRHGSGWALLVGFFFSKASQCTACREKDMLEMLG